MADKTRARIERRLSALESEMADQLARILVSPKGFGGPESLFWDKRVIERHSLRWALGQKFKPLYPGSEMCAGW